MGQGAGERGELQRCEEQNEAHQKAKQTHQERKKAVFLETPPDNHQTQPPRLIYRQTPKPVTTSRRFQVVVLPAGTRCGGACQPHGPVGQLITPSREMDQRPRLAGKKGEASKVTSVTANTLLPLGLLRKGTRFSWDHQLPLARRGWSR